MSFSSVVSEILNTVSETCLYYYILAYKYPDIAFLGSGVAYGVFITLNAVCYMCMLFRVDTLHANSATSLTKKSALFTDVTSYRVCSSVEENHFYTYTVKECVQRCVGGV